MPYAVALLPAGGLLGVLRAPLCFASRGWPADAPQHALEAGAHLLAAAPGAAPVGAAPEPARVEAGRLALTHRAAGNVRVVVVTRRDANPFDALSLLEAALGAAAAVAKAPEGKLEAERLEGRLKELTAAWEALLDAQYGAIRAPLPAKARPKDQEAHQAQAAIHAAALATVQFELADETPAVGDTEEEALPEPSPFAAFADIASPPPAAAVGDTFSFDAGAFASAKATPPPLPPIPDLVLASADTIGEPAADAADPFGSPGVFEAVPAQLEQPPPPLPPLPDRPPVAGADPFGSPGVFEAAPAQLDQPPPPLPIASQPFGGAPHAFAAPPSPILPPRPPIPLEPEPPIAPPAAPEAVRGAELVERYAQEVRDGRVARAGLRGHIEASSRVEVTACIPGVRALAPRTAPPDGTRAVRLRYSVAGTAAAPVRVRGVVRPSARGPLLAVEVAALSDSRDVVVEAELAPGAGPPAAASPRCEYDGGGATGDAPVVRWRLPSVARGAAARLACRFAPGAAPEASLAALRCSAASRRQDDQEGSSRAVAVAVL